jgi:hypothetical protein
VSALPVVGADWTPAPGRWIGEPPVDVGPLYVPTEDYAVLGVAQTTRWPGGGREIPTILTTFLVPGVSGTFSLHIDNYAFTHADPLRDLRGRSAKIRRLAALPEVLPPSPEEL